jgi:ankyrin repeat protein
MYNRDEALIGNHHGLPIHTACSSCAPIKVIKALLQAFPDGVSYPDNYGNLPIHYAAGGDEGPLDLDVVRLLLELYPKGSALGNSYGNLPMHFAAHYKAPLEVVEALYNAYPDGLLQLNKDHETPLHIAVEKGAYDDVVAFLQGKVGEMFVSSKAVVTAEAMDQTIEEENKMLKEKEKEYKAKISELEAQLAAVYFEK